MYADTWDVELPHGQPGALMPVDLAAYDMDGGGDKGILRNTGYPVVVWKAVGNKLLPHYTRSSRGESDEMLWGYLICIGIWQKKYPFDQDLKRVLQFFLPNGTLVKVRRLWHPHASFCLVLAVS